MKTIIILAIGIWVGYAWAKSKFKPRGINSDNTQRHAEKESAKRKVLELFITDETQISNSDVEMSLNVSDATATRYLDELEKDGKITQIGKTGTSVKYKLK